MYKKVLSILSILIIGLLLISACAPAPAPVEEAAPVEEEVVEEEVVEKTWKDDLGTEENPIIFVAVPSGETDRVLSGFGKMATMLYDAYGLVIEPFVATSYASAIETMCQDPPKAHMGSLATFSYVLAAEKGCAEVALVSTRYGAAFYNGQFVVRVDSGLETLEDLKGKDWCVSEAISTSGFTIPTIMFKEFGIDTATDMGELVETGSHESAAAGVFNGDCDFATTYVDARSRIEEDYPTIMDETVVIAVEPDIPNDGIQFVPGFPMDVKSKLIKGILDLFKSEEGAAAMDEAYQWSGMITEGDSFYDPFRQMLSASGVSLEEIANQ